MKKPSLKKISSVFLASLLLSGAPVFASAGESRQAASYETGAIPLTAQNVRVYERSAGGALPDGVVPGGGKPSPALYNTTSAVNSSPCQIYEISLTGAQARQTAFHVRWTGRSEREVSAYVYDGARSEWLLLGRAYDPENGRLVIEMDIENVDGIVKDGRLYLLLWRGMSESAANRGSYIPRPGEYDFSLMVVPDTQYYAQSYPERALVQFQWMADHFRALKNVLAVAVGDVVNRPFPSEEYQWRNMSAAYALLEAQGVNYAVAWGNHDYDSGEGNNILYKKYFPAQRLRQAGGQYFGDSLDNDAAYYLIEKNGAKIMLLTFPYWAGEEEYRWAENAIASHGGWSVIIAVHKYISRFGKLQDADAQRMRARLVVPYGNVKMVLNGHDSGTNVHYESIGGRGVYSVVTDYQNLPFGGGGFVRNVHFDLENDLVYFNAYSPVSGARSSGYTSGPAAEIPGFYKASMDEFVIPVDFGGSQTRTITTESLSLSGEDAIDE